MSMSWVVTGANRGLGLEFARQLKARGEDLVVTARDPESATALRELDLRVEALDVGSPESIRAFAARLEGKPVDVLVNNAGMSLNRAPFAQQDWEGIELGFAVNSLGPMRVSHALLDNLRAGERKLVAQVTSKMGSIADNTSGAAYGYRASKTALNMFNKSMSIDLAGEGFTCLLLHPGWVATDMGGSAAPLGVEESISGMLAVLDGASNEDNGRFYDYSGEAIPW